MVHRIQNRNPGYSDFSNLGSAQSFNFSNSMSTTAVDGANALKLENEIVTNEVTPEVSSTDEIKDLNEEYNEQVLNNQESTGETNIEENKEAEKPSNGLENFAIEDDEDPKLFDSADDSFIQELPSSDKDNNKSEEDDLEIPAFLRRQKN